MPNQSSNWQRELARAISDPVELIELLELDHSLLHPAQLAAMQFKLRVPRGYAARMQRGNRHDPLLRQVLPLAEENEFAPGYCSDPVGDIKAMSSPGVLNKYEGRILLTTTGACAIHCRYCFRRHFPYLDANPTSENWQDSLSVIANNSSINEVILSGGDPLTLSDNRLSSFFKSISTISHIKRLRIHTRLPIVLPERITEQLCQIMTSTHLPCTIVVHANHPNEINEEVEIGLLNLTKHGLILLNQSVLLKGVNDDANVLCELSEKLFSAHVLPYYLHLLDKVQGAAHFNVDDKVAKELWHKIAARLPGYLVPRLAREESGAFAKTIIC